MIKLGFCIRWHFYASTLSLSTMDFIRLVVYGCHSPVRLLKSEKKPPPVASARSVKSLYYLKKGNCCLSRVHCARTSCSTNIFGSFWYCWYQYFVSIFVVFPDFKSSVLSHVLSQVKGSSEKVWLAVADGCVWPNLSQSSQVRVLDYEKILLQNEKISVLW